MRLISTEHGQVLFLFVGEEVRPSSGLYLPDVLKFIAERYAFVTLPSIQHALREGAKFNQGRFIDKNRTIEIKTMGLFSDGMLVVTYNTDDAVVVLEDMISRAIDRFGIRQPLTLRPRQFASSVIVEFENSLDNALKTLQTVSRLFRRSACSLRMVCGD